MPTRKRGTKEEAPNPYPGLNPESRKKRHAIAQTLLKTAYAKFCKTNRRSGKTIHLTSRNARKPPGKKIRNQLGNRKNARTKTPAYADDPENSYSHTAKNPIPSWKCARRIRWNNAKCMTPLTQGPPFLRMREQYASSYFLFHRWRDGGFRRGEGVGGNRRATSLRDREGSRCQPQY